MKNFFIRHALFSLILSVMFAAIFFWQTFTKGLLPVPTDTLVGLYHPFRDFYSESYARGIPFKNFLITDPVRQQIPWRKIVVDDLKAGVIPWWNPFSFSGARLGANIQSGAYYPLNGIFLLFPFEIGWTFLIILQPFLSFIFMFLFLSKKGLSKSASLIGGLCFGYSGFSIAWLTWGTIGHVVLWTPLILLVLDEWLETLSLRSVRSYALSIFFILLLFLQVTAGHIQVALYCMALEIAYAVYTISCLKLNSKERVARFIHFFIVFALFIVFSLVVWLPLLQEILASARSMDPTAWNIEGWFIPFNHFIQFLIPDFFGNPATMNYFGIWNYGEFIGFIGIFPMIALTLSVFMVRKTWFWWSCLLGTLIFITPTFIGKMPYLLHLPLLSSMQPTRLLSVVDIFLSILAAYGVDFLISRKFTKSFWTYWIVPCLSIGIVCAVFILKYMTKDHVLGENLGITLRNSVVPVLFSGLSLVCIVFWSFVKEKAYGFRRVFVVCIIILSLADLFRFGWKFTPFVNGEYFFPQTALITFLEKKPKPFRVAVLDDRILPSNVLSYYGIESVDGYDPIYQKRYAEYLRALDTGDANGVSSFQRIVSVHNVMSPLLKLLNVKYYITFEELSGSNFKKVFSEGGTFVYEDITTVPRAYFASSVRYVNSDSDTLSALMNDLPIDTLRVVIEDKSKNGIVQTYNTDKSSIQFTEYYGYSMKLNVQTPNDQLLVMSQKFDPSLQVTVDGVRIIPIRVNYMFIGIVIPKGEHSISLKYTPL